MPPLQSSLWRRWHTRVGMLLTAFLLGLLWVVLGWAGTYWSGRVDLTATHIHSLGAPGRAVLERMQSPLSVIAFVATPAARKAVRRFLEPYRRLAPGFQLQLVDPLTDPERTRAYRVQNLGELILEYEGRRATIRPQGAHALPRYSEHAFINALQRLVEPHHALLGFLSGHGERSPEGQANHDLGSWSTYLKQHAFRIAVLPTPGRTAPFPADLELLVIADPRVPLGKAEQRLVEAYLEKGGNLLWLVEPGDLAVSGLRELARHMGVTVAERAMRQARSGGSGQLPENMVLVNEAMYQAHPALESFDLPTLLPGAAPLEQVPGHASGSGWNGRPLLTPVEDMGSDKQPRYRQRGIALALERSLAKAPGQLPQQPPQQATGAKRAAGQDSAVVPVRTQRAVLVGDGDFLSNRYLGNGGNAELGLRLVKWLLGEAEKVVLPVPRPPDARLDLDSETLSRLRNFFVVLLPGLILLIHFWGRVRRRRL